MRTLALDFDTLAGVCRHQAVCLLVAFGSTVRELRSPASDLDLAVWMAPTNVAPQALVKLDVALRPLFPGERLDPCPPQQGFSPPAISGGIAWLRII
jgi:predicted nucleotidyltransferase